MTGGTPVESVPLTIDGRSVLARAGQTIWEAAREAGIEIPTLCHTPRLHPVGVCRMCVVDVGGRTLAASCVRAVEPGLAVQTGTERVERSRRVLVELLMSDHEAPCARERTTGDCELEALARRYGVPPPVASPRAAGAPSPAAAPPATVGPSPLRDLPRGHGRPCDLSSPVIAVDHQACILCDRCVRACDDIQSNEVIGRTGKGYGARIAFDLDLPMGESTCVSCGECAAACPTGALTNRTLAAPIQPKRALRPVQTVCPYCGVGCSLTYHVDVAANQIAYAEGNPRGANAARLCVKGRYGFDYATHPQRLTVPLIRRAEHYPKGPLSSDVRGESAGRGRRRREGDDAPLVDYGQVLPAFREATWDEALDLVARRLLEIRARRGPSALAGFGSAKCSNEEAYLFQKLVRAVFGTNNVDHCTRLCHASSVAALLEGLGSGSVTNTYGAAAEADVVLLVGTNTTANHPVAATFFKEAAKRGTKLIVVDPRRPDLAEHAHAFCQIMPDRDVAFFNGLMNVIVAEDLVDHDFVARRTSGYDALKATVAAYTPEVAARLCGVPAEQIVEVARLFGRARAAMIFWGMGVSQHTHGTDNARCLIALCLLTGNVGRPGTGLHPLRGQNNVQGASDAGLIPMMYPDYQRVTDEAVRARFERSWGVALDPQPGLTVTEIVAGALAGRIAGMYMLGENPFLSDPDINKVRKALAALEFLVVQDIFLTETAEFADVVLPATSFFEKTGTYTNTDRRVQVGRPALQPPGQARLDWQVICEIAHRMGYPMRYDDPEQIFEEFVALAPSYAGLSYESLGTEGRLWPNDKAILFEDAFPTPSGTGRLVPCEFAPAKELPDDDFPFVLNTGRLLEHWHTGTMTRRSKALDALEPGPFVEIHPDDLARLGLADDEEVRVRSRRGEIVLPARASRRSQPGTVFIPFHFREAAANVLTIDALDPFGRIPEFKFCAVRLERAS
jgi:formate dehydrogenase major subunit